MKPRFFQNSLSNQAAMCTHYSVVYRYDNNSPKQACTRGLPTRIVWEPITFALALLNSENTLHLSSSLFIHLCVSICCHENKISGGEPKSMGSDGIYPRALKELTEVLAKLSIIYQQTNTEFHGTGLSLKSHDSQVKSLVTG